MVESRPKTSAISATATLSSGCIVTRRSGCPACSCTAGLRCLSSSRWVPSINVTPKGWLQAAAIRLTANGLVVLRGDMIQPINNNDGSYCITLITLASLFEQFTELFAPFKLAAVSKAKPAARCCVTGQKCLRRNHQLPAPYTLRSSRYESQIAHDPSVIFGSRLSVARSISRTGGQSMPHTLDCVAYRLEKL